MLLEIFWYTKGINTATASFPQWNSELKHFFIKLTIISSLFFISTVKKIFLAAAIAYSPKEKISTSQKLKKVVPYSLSSFQMICKNSLAV